MLSIPISIAEELKRGKIGVLPTDTVYGISCVAADEAAVDRVRQLRGRENDKRFIVLIADISDLDTFGVELTPEMRGFLQKYWPGRVSVELPVGQAWEYLHRGHGRFGFRLPDEEDLRKIIRAAGPVISTSVNPPGEPPAKDIAEAKAYFGDALDFYVDVGPLASPPSTLVALEEGEWRVVRQGEVEISEAK